MTDPNLPTPPSDPDLEIGDLPSFEPEAFRPSPPDRLHRKAAAQKDTTVSVEPGSVDEPKAQPEPPPRAPQETPSPSVEAPPARAHQWTGGGTKTPSPVPLPRADSMPPLEPGVPDEPATSSRPGNEDSKDEFSAPSDHPNPPASHEEAVRRLLPSERIWMLALFVGVLLVAAVAFWLIRGGLPSTDASRPEWSPSLPVKGERITIEKITGGWARTSSGKTPSLRGAAMVPRIEIAIAPTSHGALRIFFRDERNQSVGDTENLTVRQGKFTTGTSSIIQFCTDGLRSDLDFSDLRSRSNKFWTVEIMEGPDTLARKSEFRPLLTLGIPWELAEDAPSK